MERGTRLSTEILEQDGVPLVRGRGEIDVHTVPEFERALRTGIERGASALVVDLSDISYLNSAGLSALVAAYKVLSARDAALYVVAPPGRPGVRRVLEITRLDALMNVRDTVEEAIAQIKASTTA